MRSMVRILVPVFLAFALLMVACAETAGDFEDTTWVLESYGEPGNLKTVLADTEVTATFNSADARVTGKAGCNNYFGSYEVKSSKLTLPGPIGSTKMSCGEQIDKQEYDFLQAFQAAESYKIENGRLHITCGTQTLVFKPQ